MFTKEDLKKAFEAGKKRRSVGTSWYEDIFPTFEDYYKIVQRERLNEETTDPDKIDSGNSMKNYMRES